MRGDNSTPPLEVFRKAFWKHYLNDTPKSAGVMHGYLSKRNNPSARKDVPSGPKLTPEEFYDALAAHRFILSPQGDRPDCYRHYEALGLGTIPITDMSPDFYHHLQNGPILYNTSDWYLDESEALQRLGVTSFPQVQRLLALEEYWMEYVDRQVNGGTRLRWFDRLQSEKATLDGFIHRQEQRK